MWEKKVMRRKKHQKACYFKTQRDSISHHPGNIILPVEIVELEKNSYHLIISLEINGIQGDVIIDTGASVTVIDKQLLEEQDILTTETCIQSGSVTGQISDVKVVKTKSIKIGGIPFKNIHLAAIDLDYVNEMYNHHLKRKIIGLLGCDFCVKHRVVIDYQKKILICRR